MSTIPQSMDRVLRDDSGAIAIMVAALAVVLIGMAAFAVDMGVGYASKRQLSAAMDAAALAGAQAAGLAYPAGTSCLAVKSTLQAAAQNAAKQTLDASPPAKLNTPLPADWLKVNCVTLPNGKTAVDVTASGRTTWQAVFGGTLGVSSMSPNASAVARVQGAEQYGGLRPYTICAATADLAMAQPNNLFLSMYRSDNQKATDPCTATGTPGNWGAADFDGSNDPTTLASWIRNGYWGTAPVVIPGPISGNPGNPAPTSVTDDLDAILGQTIPFPLATSWTASGNGAKFQSAGVIYAKLCGWSTSGRVADSGFATNCDAAKLTTAKAAAQAAWDAQPNDAQLRLILIWEYVNRVPSYTGGSTTNVCDIGTDTRCRPVVRLYQ